MTTKTREKPSVATAILTNHAEAAQSALKNVEAMMSREARKSTAALVPEEPFVLRRINKLISSFEAAEADLGTGVSEDDPRMKAMDQALNDLFDYQPSTIEAVHKKVQFLIHYDHGRLIGYTEDNTCLSSLLRSLADRPRGFSGCRRDAASGPCYAIVDDYDLGPVSQEALDLISAHKAADKRYNDAVGAEDKDGGPSAAERTEIDAARAEVYATAVACIAFRGKSNADRAAMSFAAEEVGSDILTNGLDLPYVLRDAMVSGFRSGVASAPKRANSEPFSERITQLQQMIDRHRTAEAAFDVVDAEWKVFCARPCNQAEDDVFEQRLSAVSEVVLNALYPLHDWQCQNEREARLKFQYLLESPDLRRHLKDFVGTADEFFESLNFQALAVSVADSPSDPLHIIARAAAQAYDRYALYEEKGGDAKKAKDQLAETYFRGAESDAYDLYYRLRRSLSNHEAQSAVGAMVQLAEAVSALDLGCSSDGGVTKEDQVTLERLMLSALRFIERQHGAGLEHLGLGCLRNSNSDMWEPVENRLAALRAERKDGASTNDRLSSSVG